MNGTEIKDVVLASVDAFPAMSGTAAKALQLLQAPNADGADIEAVIKYDPGLTANVLRIANSAYFCGAMSIGSVRQAVVRLGWKRMSEVVIASTVNALMAGPVPGYDLPSGDLWRHAVASTVAADILAAEHHVKAPDELFTSALIHDVGKLVMGEFVKPFFDQFQMLAESGIPFDRAEREILGTDHAEVGAMILKQWGLPENIVGAVRWHHRPDAADQGGILVDLVHLADMACMLLNIGIGKDGMRYQPSLRAVSRIGVETSRLQHLAEKIIAGLEGFGATLAAEKAAV